MDVANQQVNPFGDHELKAKLTDHLRLLVGNISRVLEYYNSKNRTAELKKIYVGGIGARIQGLKELLENEFEGLEFEMLANLPNLNVPRSNRLCRTKSSEFTACIGAAWPTINLLQESEKDKLKKSIVFSVISLIAVICAATLIVWNGITEYKNTLSIREELNAEVAKLSEIEVLEQQYNAAAQTLTEIQAMDQLTYRYNEEWNDIIHNFELELPTNTVITSLASTNSGLTMNITLKTKEEAAKLLIQLKKMPYFTSVTINELTHIVDPDTRIQAVTFSVACAYYEEQTVEAGAEGVTQDGTQAVNGDVTTGVTQDTTQTVIESRPASTNQSDQSANTGNEVNP
jgi:type IV pilus assembly protein PilM